MDSYCNSNVVETRTLKTGEGWLFRVIINDTGTSGSFIEIYDNTAASGKLIAKIDPNTDSVRLYDLPFAIGLTYKSNGAPGNFTVVYQ